MLVNAFKGEGRISPPIKTAYGCSIVMRSNNFLYASIFP